MAAEAGLMATSSTGNGQLKWSRTLESRGHRDAQNAVGEGRSSPEWRAQ